MKQGMTVPDMVTEIERQVATRKDYLAPTSKLRMIPEAMGGVGPVHLAGLNGAEYGLRPLAHGQLAQELGIPKAYYDRMLKDSPDLLAQNVNHWMHSEPKTRMVRTLDHEVRAILSDRFRPLDNYDLMQAALPALRERNLRLVSSTLTDTRLYLKVTDPALSAPAPRPRRVGDLVEGGIVIRNSEVGDGALAIEALLFQLSCLNGAIIGIAVRKFHVGKRAEYSEDVLSILSNEARQASDKAFWLVFRDAVKAAFDPKIFEGNVEKMTAAADRAIATTKIEKVIENVVEVTLGARGSDTIKGSLLKHFVEGGDLTQWGLSYAMTLAAQADGLDYETATEMERAGGQVITLSQKDWEAVAA